MLNVPKSGILLFKIKIVLLMKTTHMDSHINLNPLYFSLHCQCFILSTAMTLHLCMSVFIEH